MQEDYKQCVTAVSEIIKSNPEEFSKALFSALGPFFAMELFDIASDRDEIKPKYTVGGYQVGSPIFSYCQTVTTRSS